MTDYPNHLARMYLLVSSGTATQNPYYDVKWGFYPNLAMDILVPLLAHLVSVELATKFFYIFSALLVVTGSLAIEYQVKREIKLSPFTSLMFLNSWPSRIGISEFRVWAWPRPLGNRNLAAPQGSRMVDPPVCSLGPCSLVVRCPLFCARHL